MGGWWITIFAYMYLVKGFYYLNYSSTQFEGLFTSSDLVVASLSFASQFPLVEICVPHGNLCPFSVVIITEKFLSFLDIFPGLYSRCESMTWVICLFEPEAKWTYCLWDKK